MKEESLDIKLLMLFKYLAESRSVSKTSSYFDIPQSSISYHINRLESYFEHIRLFDCSQFGQWV